MATKYDPALLQDFADQLYSKARWVLARAAILGFVAGWVADLVVFSLAHIASTAHASSSGQWILPLIGLVVGYVYGSGKAFQLKLEAQRTLCQLQIERNTHALSSAPSGLAQASRS